MKNKFEFKIKSFYFVLGIFSIMLLTFSISYALLTSRDIEENKFKASKNEIEIIEEFNPPETVKAGVPIPKKPSIKNIGNEDACIRAKVLFSSSIMKGRTDPLVLNSNWYFVNGDAGGWYYYRNVLKVGATSQAIFNSITVKSGTADNLIEDFEVIIHAESVNADNHSNCEQAFSS